MFTNNVPSRRKPVRKFSVIESLEVRVLLTSMGAALIEADAGNAFSEVLIVSDSDGISASSDSETLNLLQEPAISQQIESESNLNDVYVDNFSMDTFLWESELAHAETYPTVDYVYVHDFAMDTFLWEPELEAAELHPITTSELIDSSVDGETFNLLEEPIVSLEIGSEPVDLTLDSDPQVGMGSFGSLDPFVGNIYSDAGSFESIESDSTIDDVFIDDFALNILLAGI